MFHRSSQEWGWHAVQVAKQRLGDSVYGFWDLSYSEAFVSPKIPAD